MKRLIHTLTALLLNSIVVTTVFCQVQTTIEGIYQNKIEGNVVFSTREYLFAPFRNQYDRAIDTAKIAGGRFRFMVPVATDKAYVSLTIPNSLKENGGRSTIAPLSNYLVGQGSDITMHINGAQLSFSGKGAALLECQYKMDSIPGYYRIRSLHEQDSLKQSLGFRGFLEFMNRQQYLFYRKKLDVLKSYQNRISKESYERLYTDYNAERVFDGFGDTFGLGFRQFTPEQKAEYLKYYQDSLLKIQPDNSYPDQLVASKYYGSALLRKIIADIKFQLNDFTDKSPAVDSAVFDRLKQNYTGLLQEKLLTDFIVQLYARRPVEYVSAYLEQVDGIIKEPKFKDIVSSYSGAGKGMPAYNFKLPDTKGQMVRLADFKGRLLVIDFWFKGCTQCVKIEEQMKEIRKVFKDNKGVAFLSVNVDAKKENWLAGIKTGLYTEEKNSNVSTYGLGVQHPFFKYYGYSGCPQLLIIGEDQTVVDSNPVKPMFESGRQGFITMIEQLVK